ncbi:hypothetical protein GUJ93_ZPchr0001g31704 [Zizania palustris]|uniref:Uncharacterized protein n=1 Tax=Zizania palustris TaxID=103762 RepID=A0A8J5VAU4_ZIZPA|nr:hypothetical protein GUJ93_ZPchr0001g31704 [Zizania palustris]
MTKRSNKFYFFLCTLMVNHFVDNISTALLLVQLFHRRHRRRHCGFDWRRRSSDQHNAQGAFFCKDRPEVAELALLEGPDLNGVTLREAASSDEFDVAIPFDDSAMAALPPLNM